MGVVDAVFASHARHAQVSTAMYAGASGGHQAPNAMEQWMLDFLLTSPDMPTDINDPQRCKFRLEIPGGAEPNNFESFVKVCATTAARIHHLEALHKLHVCVGVLKKLMCWYECCITLFANALAKNEAGYTDAQKEQRFQWAYEILKHLMDYSSDYGSKGTQVRNDIRQALETAGVPLMTRQLFLANRMVPQTEQEECP